MLWRRERSATKHAGWTGLLRWVTMVWGFLLMPFWKADHGTNIAQASYPWAAGRRGSITYDALLWRQEGRPLSLLRLPSQARQAGSCRPEPKELSVTGILELTALNTQKAGATALGLTARIRLNQRVTPSQTRKCQRN